MLSKVRYLENHFETNIGTFIKILGNFLFLAVFVKKWDLTGLFWGMSPDDSVYSTFLNTYFESWYKKIYILHYDIKLKESCKNNFIFIHFTTNIFKSSVVSALTTGFSWCNFRSVHNWFGKLFWKNWNNSNP